MSLIIGPGPGDLVYIERHTKPALNDAFAARLKSRVIRNDGLFNAALVGLGSFGFIHGVLIETEDLFLLKRYTRKINPETAIKIAETMDFANSEFLIPEELDSGGKGLKPYHFKVYINPTTTMRNILLKSFTKRNMFQVIQTHPGD